MPLRIQAPDGSVVEFPDGTSDDVIAGAMRRTFGGPTSDGAPSAPAPPPAAQLDPRSPHASSFLTGAFQGMTGNFGDELVAGALAPVEAGIAAYKGDDAGKGLWDRLTSGYEHAKARENATVQQAYADNPAAATAGNLVGGLATGGKIAQAGGTALKVAAPTTPGLLGRGALEGGAYGAVYGAGEGDGLKDRLDRAVQGGAIGAATGGLVGGVTGAVAGRNAGKGVPTTEQLHQMGEDAYKLADKAGLILGPSPLQSASQKIKSDLADFGYHPTLQPRLAPVLDEIDRAGQGYVTLKGVDTIRKMARAAGKDPMNPSGQAASEIVTGHLDDMLDGLTTKDILMGDKSQGLSALSQARQYWSRYRKSDLLDTAVEKAQRRAASTGSGGNVDNATRQNIRAILDNPKKVAGFSADERAAMEQVVRGTPTQNAVRLVGKLSPGGNGLMAALGLGATAVNPLMAAAPAAGIVAKTLADKSTAANVQSLQNLVRAGAPQAAGQLTGRAQGLLEMLVQAAGQQGARIPIGTSP